MKAYVWILSNQTLDETHFGDILCWGCTECGNAGHGEYGQRYPREQWKAFKVGPNKRDPTEGYVLGNWALSPYPDETLIWYLPFGQSLPANFADWEKALITLRQLYRNLPRITADPAPDPTRKAQLEAIQMVKDLYKGMGEADSIFEHTLKGLRKKIMPPSNDREITAHARRYLKGLCDDNRPNGPNNP